MTDTLKLYPYQLKNIDTLKRYLQTTPTHCAYLGDEQGLGKTAQACTLFKNLQHVLVVCPATLRFVWIDEMKKWANKDYTAGTSRHPLKKPKTKDVIQYYVISYDILSHANANDWIFKTKWHGIIFDEAHYLKNPATKRTKAALKRLQGAYKLFLSGTPMPNNIVDAQPVWGHILPDEFGNFWSFVARYTSCVQTQYGTKYLGVKHSDELKEIAYKNFLVRNTKEEVLKDLPSKTFQRIPCTLNSPVHGQLKIEDEAQLKTIADFIEGKAGIALPNFASQRRELGIQKINFAIDYISQLVGVGTDDGQMDCVVVYAYHNDVIDTVSQTLTRRGIKNVVVKGDTPPAKRAEYVKEFQDKESGVKVFIGNIIAAGEGITLTRASTIVFLELDWVPGRMAQASDRVHRIGQKSNVTIQYLIAMGTLDEQIEKSLMTKVKSISLVLTK